MLKIRAFFPKLNEKFSKTICALIPALARKMKGHCGADIESVVRDGIEAAFVAGKDHVTTEDLQAAIGRTHPISETMKDAIEEMDKTYKSKKFTNASREE